MGKQDELEREKQRRIAVEADLAALKEKIPLNYYEPFPGVRVKRWVVIAMLDMVLFWSILLNFSLTENQMVLLFLGCAFGPAIWMAWKHTLTGVNYFDS